MIILELAFGDDERRMAARPAHRQQLAQLRSEGVLVMAGPWHDGSGALLVFRTSKERVREIMSVDPYYTTPGVTVTSLREWEPVIDVPSTVDG